MKKTLFFFLACLLTLIALPVCAEEVPSTPLVNVAVSAAEAPAKIVNTTKNLPYLITKGQNLINTRVVSLNALKKKINASKISDEQKSALNIKVDDRISKLTDLAAQIKSGTNIDAVRAQVKSIFTDYRIYAVFIPQISSNLNLFVLGSHIDNLLNDTVVKIQARIDSAKGKGKDVTAKQASLDSGETKLTELKTSIQGLVDKVNTLTPADYPTTSKNVLSETKTKIKDIRTQITRVRPMLVNARGTAR